MSQPSVVNYFSTRKRVANDDLKSVNAKKVLVLDSNSVERVLKNHSSESLSKEVCPKEDIGPVNVKMEKINNTSVVIKQKLTRTRKNKVVSKQNNLHTLLNNISYKEPAQIITNTTPKNDEERDLIHHTPPPTPTKKVNAMDKVKPVARELSFNELKQKMSRSSRLAELKASINKFKQLDTKLQEVEKETTRIDTSPNLKSFRTIELEVALSPTKTSPEKSYLSPRKDTSVRRNLINLLSPTKNAVALPSCPVKSQILEPSTTLFLPFKYKQLLEFFRNIDTVVQIMNNRKEVITFRKLKPAVEELIKRNLYEKHLSQIQFLFPDAFRFKQEKLRAYGMGVRQEQWELVIEPVLNQDLMSSDIIIERKRKFYSLLLERTIKYHAEFLLTLDPPIHIEFEKLKRWHPEFNIENVPDVESSSLPLPPQEEKYTTGKDVLEKAKFMFNCNTRMEEALERLKQSKENNLTSNISLSSKPNSVLKGIPKCLLEKVRQKQAAKALQSMTRSTLKDKELQVYGRLPELARLTRNLFVAEKKNVLHLEIVTDKMCNSFGTYLTKDDMENHLKTISKEVPDWLNFHNIRGCTYLKISKNSDLSLVLSKLSILAKQKEL